jgi:hypothetical protein
LELFSPNSINGSRDVRLLGVYLVSAQVADGASELSAPPTAPPRPVAPQSPESLKIAKDLVSLPARFTGKRPFARFVRAIGFDKLWLRMHERRFRRAYTSIGLIVDYLQREKRA